MSHPDNMLWGLLALTMESQVRGKSANRLKTLTSKICIKGKEDLFC